MARKILARTGVVLFGILLALVLLEGGMRVWFSINGTERERVMYLYDRATIDSKSAQFVGVPFLNYTLNPAQNDVDKRGIRGLPTPVAVPKPDGVFRIVALGGSTTYGHDLRRRQAWPFVLEALLREKYGYSNVEVVNLGVPGYYSLNSLVNLETRGLALEPDLVIDYDGINDASIRIYQDPVCTQADTPLFGLGNDQGVWQYSGGDLPASTLYRFFAIRFGWMADPTELTTRLTPTGWCPPTDENNVPFLDRLGKNPPVYFERNLRSIAAIAESNGAKMMFMSFAWDSTSASAELAADPSLEGTSALLSAIKDQNALVKTIASDTDSLFLDLAPQMEDPANFQGDHIHQTALGSERQAEIIAAFLASQGVIPK